MSQVICSFDREFQLWAYTVSHGRIMFRSVRDSNHSTRIDIVFFDVQRMEINTMLRGFELYEETSSTYKGSAAPPGAMRQYRIVTREGEATIAALNVAFEETTRGYEEPSDLWNWSPDAAELSQI
jgi:hypothetical protein